MKNRLLILTICLIATIKMMAQEFTLHGKVVDENNQPLEFAIVSVASQGKTAVTSLKGDYSLKLHSAADFFCAAAPKEPLKKAMQQVANNNFFILIYRSKRLL